MAKRLIGLFSIKGKTSEEVAQEAWRALQKFNQLEQEEQAPKPRGKNPLDRALKKGMREYMNQFKRKKLK